MKPFRRSKGYRECRETNKYTNVMAWVCIEKDGKPGIRVKRINSNRVITSFTSTNVKLRKLLRFDLHLTT